MKFPKPIKHTIHSLLTVGITTYVITYLLLLLNANSLMFRPHAPGYGSEEFPKLITGTDTIYYDYHFNPEAEKTILYSHGNAEDLGDIRFILEEFYNCGYSVIGYDYPGYGRSSGKPTEQSCNEAITAVYHYLITEQKINPKDIVVMGHSVGGGPSTELAFRNPVGALILESTFTSAYRVLTKFKIFPTDIFDNYGKIDRISVPLFVIHGSLDNVIPQTHGRRLFRKANEPKQSLWLDGVGHNDIYSRGGKKYWDSLNRFISQQWTD